MFVSPLLCGALQGATANDGTNNKVKILRVLRQYLKYTSSKQRGSGGHPLSKLLSFGCGGERDDKDKCQAAEVRLWHKADMAWSPDNERALQT
jgi:hypothetical protein